MPARLARVATTLNHNRTEAIRRATNKFVWIRLAIVTDRLSLVGFTIAGLSRQASALSGFAVSRIISANASLPVQFRDKDKTASMLGSDLLDKITHAKYLCGSLNQKHDSSDSDVRDSCGYGQQGVGKLFRLQRRLRTNGRSLTALRMFRPC